jgi:predicted aconitase with swiveling domain
MIRLNGRKIFGGTASGAALVSREPISFFGGVDPDTGIVMEEGHPLKGESIAGRVLVFPRGKGSTVGSYTLYRLKKNGKAPAAILTRECETIVAVGTIISEIPCLDGIDIDKIQSGMVVEADADRGTVSLPDQQPVTAR